MSVVCTKVGRAAFLSGKGLRREVNFATQGLTVLQSSYKLLRNTV